VAKSSRIIDLESITLLSERDLADLGITLGPRKKILNAITLLPRAGVPGPAHTNMPGAERRHLTILFCDMVASTEYADSLDPEDFRRLVETFLRICNAVVQCHKGLVASYIGDAVSAFFGYPVADEDDAERAVLAGLEIIETIAALADTQEQPFRVRLGIASGEVVVGNFVGAPAGVSTVAFGDVAHLAARLQEFAEPNSIVADATTFQATKGAIWFADLGRHALKGFSDPVQIWKVNQARSLPSRFAKRTRFTKLCGRDTELRRLMRSWEEVSTKRQGQVVVISGEAGIGKSRLLHELQERLQASTQLVMQCSPTFQNSTLYPFLTELKCHARIGDAGTVEDKLAKLRRVLSVSEVPINTALPIFANLLSIPTTASGALTDISSEHHRAITEEVFTDWFGNLARANTLLMLFEDEQWADQTSRELLDALIKKLPFIPVLILVSVRGEHGSAISEREDLLQLELKALDPADAAELIQDMSPENTLSDEVVALVLHRAEGVPLYIEELTQSALEVGGGSAPASPDGRSTEIEIPTTLQSSLLARLDRLGPAREIAQVAATIGREFSVELLREVSGLLEPDIEVALTNLEQSRLIVPKGGAEGSEYFFRHTLLQQAAERTLLRDRSQELHALIGKTMESCDPEASSVYPEVLAQHFGDGGLYDRAADYWLLAGLKAAKTWAKVEAARMFRVGIEAAEKLPDTSERKRRILQLELERGDVLYAAFGYLTGEGNAAYHRAIRLSDELGDPDAPIRALDGLFGTHFNSSRYSDAAGVGDRLIEIGEHRDNLKALVLGLQFKGMSLFCQGQLTSAQLYLERALRHKESADKVGSDFPSMAMIYLSLTMQILGHNEAALDYFREAETTVRQQSAYRLAACLGDGCLLYAFREDSATVAQLTEELLPLAEKHGFNLWANMAQILRGWAMADTEGSLDGAALMQDAVEALEDQEVDKSCYLGLLAKAHLRTGQLERAEEAVKKGLNQAKKTGEHYYTAELLRLRGEIELCRGTGPDIAEASFREALAFAQGQAAKSWEINASESLARLLETQGR
jgi:class 3 adenylate cyclase/tetratricopeptide (TPR) repeat protein